MIDFMPADGDDGARDALLAPMPGGAAANTAVAAAKLGAKVAFIGKVGADGFGRKLVEVMGGYGVDTSFMTMTEAACTTMAFVTLAPDGEREFTFARKPGADMMLGESDILDGLFRPGDILHFGSLGLVPGSPSKKAHLKAILAAKEAGALVSFDPNVRLPLWDCEDVLRETILEFLPYADIVKVSSDEMPVIFGTDEEVAAAAYCFRKGVSVFFVTRGADGAAAYLPNYYTSVKGIAVKAVDTTGAGDAFNGAILSRFLGRPLAECLDPAALGESLSFANNAGAAAVTHKGAM